MNLDINWRMEFLLLLVCFCSRGSSEHWYGSYMVSENGIFCRSLLPGWAKTHRVIGCDTCESCRSVGARADLSGRAPRWCLACRCWQWNMFKSADGVMRQQRPSEAPYWQKQEVLFALGVWNLESQLYRGAEVRVSKWPFPKHLAHSPDLPYSRKPLECLSQPLWWKFLNNSKGTKQSCGWAIYRLGGVAQTLPPQCDPFPLLAHRPSQRCCQGLSPLAVFLESNIFGFKPCLC